MKEEKNLIETVEEYKPIIGYETEYLISNFGFVKTIKFGWNKVMKPYTDKDGYKVVGLTVNNKTKAQKIHRLVALHFIPNPNNLPMVNHKDINTANNHVSNLEWCDALYNIRYGIEFGNINNKGENSSISIFKDYQVIEIREKFSNSFITSRELSKLYNVNESAIDNIVRNKTWTHLPLSKTPNERNWEKYENVRKDYNNDIKINTILLKYQISNTTFNTIIKYETYLDKKGWTQKKFNLIRDVDIRREQVKEIRQRLKNGEKTNNLRKEFKLNKSTFSKIVNYKTYLDIQ